MSTQTARKPMPAASMNETIENRIDETSRLVRKVDFSLSILTLLSVVLGVLLLAVLADHWLFADGLSAGLRTALFVGLVLAVGFYVYRRIVPLFLYPINPVYAASILEETSPSLKNSIVNWILLRRERTERGSMSDKLTERMFDGVTRTAASGVVGIPSDRAVDLRGIAHWGIVLTLLLLLFVGYGVFSPKSPMTSLARIMLPFSGIRTPQAVRFLDVEPGNHTALQGERLTVSAELVGRTVGQEPVYLFFSTDDGQAVRQAVPMSLPEGKTRYEAPFPPGKSGFVSGVDYWLQQGESRSDKFRIDVRPTASIEVASLTYTYPAYTGLDEEVVEDGGDIRGVEGTEVRVAVRSTLPLQRVDLVMDNDPSKAVSMKPFGENEAAATLTLRHDPQSSTPTTVRNYSFRAVDSDGYESRRSGIFRMEVLPDRPPVVQWSDTDEKLAEYLKGADQIEVPLNGSLELPIQAEDPDFGLRYLRFHVESGNKRIRPVELLESPATGPTKHTGPIKAKTVFSPITSRLTEGDTAEIWAEAVDTKFPEPNSAVTRRITIVVGTPQKQEEPKEEEKKDEKKDREKDKDQSKDENKEENDKKDGDEAFGEKNETEQNEEGGDSEPDDSTKKKDDQKSDDVGQEDSKDGDKKKGEPEPKENQEDSEKDDKNSGDEQGGKQENKPGETGEKRPGGEDSSTEKGERNSDENSNKNQDGDKQQGESGEQNQNGSKGDKNGAKKEKPVDPDTQDGDAMERIIEQMKKEKKLPGDDKNDSAKPGQDEQKPKEKDEPKQDGQDKPKQDGKDEPKKDGQPEPQQKEPKKEPKKDCPNKDCPGECSSCNGGGSKDGGSKDGGKSGQGGKEGGEEGGQDGGQETGKADGSKDDSKDGSKDSPDSGGDSGSSAGTDGTKKDGNQAGKPEGASGDDSEGEAEDGAGGGGEESPGGKSGGDKNSGGGGPGDKDSDPSRSKNDNRNSDGEDVPVDPNDNAPRDRDRSLDENSQDRRSQGGDSSEPKKTDETVKDMPDNTTTSGDTGKGQESRQQGSSDRTQSAEDGDMKGDSGEGGDSGVEQEGGSEGTGEKQPGDGGEQQSSSGQEGEDSQGDASTKSGQGTQGTADSNDSSGSSLGPGGNGGSSQAGGPTPKDEANLEYTEKVTNLVLEYLEDQLKDAPNQDLLDNLGWTEQDLRRFHERWKEMSEQGRKPDLKDGSDQWREALKSLGIRPSRERQEQRRSHSDFKDDGTSTESQRLAPPKALQRQHQRYTEGIGTGH